MKLSLSGRLWESPKGYRVTLAEHIRAASKLGYAGIELRYPLLPKPDEIPAIQALLKENRVQAVFAFCAAVPKDDASRADAMRVVEIVQKLGGTHVRLAVFKEEELPSVRELAESAGKLGIRVALHVHTGTLCDSADKALAAVRTVNHSNVCLLADPIHLVLAGEPDVPGAIARIGPHTGLVNLQNYRIAPDDAAGSIKIYGKSWFAAPPGHPQGLDFRSAITAFRKAGYDGWLNVMCSTTETEDPAAVARAYIDHLRPLVKA